MIDGRVVGVLRSGFLSGRLVVPRFVLDELQAMARDFFAVQETARVQFDAEEVDVYGRPVRGRGTGSSAAKPQAAKPGQSQRSGGTTSLRCKTCGGAGHLANSCPGSH